MAPNVSHEVAKSGEIHSKWPQLRTKSVAAPSNDDSVHSPGKNAESETLTNGRGERESLAHLTKLGKKGGSTLLLLMVSMIVANSKEKKWETGGDGRRGGDLVSRQKRISLRWATSLTSETRWGFLPLSVPINCFYFLKLFIYPLPALDVS